MAAKQIATAGCRATAYWLLCDAHRPVSGPQDGLPWRPVSRRRHRGSTAVTLASGPRRFGTEIGTTGAGRTAQAKASISANRDWGQHQGSKQASQHIAWTVVAANANKDAAFRCGELDTDGFDSLLGRRLRFFRDRAVSLRLIYSGRHRSISRACEPVHT
jgi:hypothetical protein